MILYVFYTHLIYQIKIKFDFASIFCQFMVAIVQLPLDKFDTNFIH